MSKLVDRIPTTFISLLQLWIGEEVPLAHVEVLLPSGAWHRVITTRQKPDAGWRTPSLLDLKALDLSTVAKWVDLSAQLGPIPALATYNISRFPMQVGAQLVATALESLHRRLMPDARRFTKQVKARDVAKVRRAARSAAADAVRDSFGDDDQKEVQQAVTEALGHLCEPTYARRLAELLPAVTATAPGLLGPDLEAWIKAMKGIRNVQSHGAHEHDAFDEGDIALYYVHAYSGHWALRTLLLLQITDQAAITSALRRSTKFGLALANIDREHIWGDFSALQTFRASSSRS